MSHQGRMLGMTHQGHMLSMTHQRIMHSMTDWQRQVGPVHISSPKSNQPPLSLLTAPITHLHRPAALAGGFLKAGGTPQQGQCYTPISTLPGTPHQGLPQPALPLHVLLPTTAVPDVQGTGPRLAALPLWPSALMTLHGIRPHHPKPIPHCMAPLLLYLLLRATPPAWTWQGV